MGKIIQNGISFSATADNASHIIYDNSTSGITSQTAQGAIDELSSKTASNQQALAAKGDTVEYHEDTQLLLLKSGDNIVSFTHLEAGGGVASILHVGTHEETWKGNQNVTIEVKDSEENITGGHFDENGDYVARLHYLGDYIITVTDEDGTQYIKHFNNEAIGGIYYVFVERYGYLGWLNSANISTTTIHSLDDVFADEKVLRELFTKHASVDFLKDWFTNEPEIIDTFVANANAMKWLGLRDYAYDTLTSAINGLEAKILASDNWECALKDHVPVMTSNTAPYGTASTDSTPYTGAAYYAFNGNINPSNMVGGVGNGTELGLSYKFVNPICVKKFTVCAGSGNVGRLKSFKIRASNDGSSWVDIGEFVNPNDVVSHTYSLDNNEYYLFYKLYAYGGTHSSNSSYNTPAVCYLQFYGRQLNVSVPVMTSNTAPWGEAIASSIMGSSNDAWNAFVESGNWKSSAHSSSDTNEWVGYDFKKSVCVKYCEINIVDDTANTTSGDLYIEASNDKNAWEKLYNTTHKIASTETAYKILLNNKNYYRYYRIRMLKNNQYNGSASVLVNSIKKINFYGVDYSEREFEEGSTMKYIYDHGVELEEIIQDGNGGTFAKNPSSIECNDTSTSDHIWAVIKNSIDLTSFSLARCNTLKGTSINNIGTIALVKNIGDSLTPVYKYFETSLAPNNQYCDISSVNEGYHTSISAANNNTTGNVEFSELWLE